MDHAIHILVLLLATRLMGECFERMRLPAAIGAIAAGIVLGLLATTSFGQPLLGDLRQSQFLNIIAEYGIFLLILYASIEIRPREMAARSGRSLLVAFGGAAVPLALGFALAWSFLPETPLKFAQALLVGVALSISAIPVAVEILEEMGLLHTTVGTTIVSAAVFDDIIGLFLLAVVLSFIRTGTGLDLEAIVVLFSKVLFFFAVTLTFAQYALPALIRAASHFRIPSSEFSALIVVALGFAVLAEMLGMDFILGPFVAGLFFDPQTVGDDIYNRVKMPVQTIVEAVFAPLFFASIGARIELSAITAIPGFLCLLLLVAFLGKLIGAGIPAKLTGLSTREATAVGIGLSGRGAVELIIASIALNAGLFAGSHILVANLFSALVITAVVTTLLVPLGLHLVLKGQGSAKAKIDN